MNSVKFESGQRVQVAGSVYAGKKGTVAINPRYPTRENVWVEFDMIDARTLCAADWVAPEHLELLQDESSGKYIVWLQRGVTRAVAALYGLIAKKRNE